MPVSTQRRVPVSMFTVHPDKAGIVAVWIDEKPRRRGCFIGISSVKDPAEGVPMFKADGDTMWVSPIGRIGQVYDHGVLSVTIDGEEYHTGQGYTNGPYVPDGDLLCQYLMGDVSADDVKAAAVKQEEQESAEAVLKILMPLLAANSEASVGLEQRARLLASDHALLLQQSEDMTNAFLEMDRIIGGTRPGLPLQEVVPQAVEELKRKYQAALMEIGLMKPVWQLLVDYGLAKPLEEATSDDTADTIFGTMRLFGIVWKTNRIAGERLGTPLRLELRTYLDGLLKQKRGGLGGFLKTYSRGGRGSID
ncbi:MAG: hypothetical protein IPJ68_00665 [Candidatus Moraniibacteriota bacterium]|nr:MAG: hypothetical protein IPJ68_00665 [Candidatus Moranbacteria bacterium]